MASRTPEKTEALFYHLELRPLDEVLPVLVERTLERGWRAVIQAGSMERLEALDTLLWTFRDDSFVPHAIVRGRDDGDHPVALVTDDANPNRADVRFCVDGADCASFDGWRRVVVMFDGRDGDEVSRARTLWKRAVAAGCDATYWQQAPSGKWERKA